MAYSESQKRATAKYKAKMYDHIDVTVPKGQREVYKAQAAEHGLSLNAYIIRLLQADRGGAAAGEEPTRTKE